MYYINKVNAGGTEYDLHAEALESAATIDGIEFDGLQSVSHYAVCATAGATAAKEVTLGNDFTLSAGAYVTVKFANANTASNPTLNVNGSGAVAIMLYGTTPADQYTWDANSVMDFVYDGTYWQAKDGSAVRHVDSELDEDSTYPIQNQAVAAALAEKLDADKFPEAFPTDTLFEQATAVFPDGADNIPIKSLIIDILPVQSGSGDPAPDNVRAISGWKGANVYCAGRNMIDDTDVTALNSQVYYRAINTSYNTWYPANDSRSFAFPCKPSTTYTVSCRNPEGATLSIFRVGYITVPISSPGTNATVYSGVYKTAAGATTITTGANATAIVIQLNASYIRKAMLQIEVGSTATDYEPYAGVTKTVSWESEAGTVYGGTLDLTTGVLTVTHANIASYDGETINEPWISSEDVYTSGATPTTGAQVVYPLTSPQTYQLTPVEVKTLLADNTVWADCGNINTLTYHADPTLFVNRKIAASQRLMELIITADRSDTMTAPYNLTSGQLIIVNGKLYKAAENIASGAELVPNSNVTETTVAAELAALA